MGWKFYCQIYCQIRGFEGIGGDKSFREISRLLIPSNPSLSPPVFSRSFNDLAADPSRLVANPVANRIPVACGDGGNSISNGRKRPANPSV